MRFCLGLLCAAFALLLPIRASAVCGDPQPRLVCAEYFASQLVVEATLAQTQELHDKDDPEGISAFIFTLHVKRTFRGKIVETVHIYEGNDSGRATFAWVPGRDYLLFLFYVASDKSWELDGCGNSGPLSKAGMALAQIAEIKKARGGGVIHGVIRGETFSTTISGVHVEARGTTGLYTATTNDNGEFQLNVPAGRYVVRVLDERGITFNTADFSYEDPRNIRIEPGGCAQVQLYAVEDGLTR